MKGDCNGKRSGKPRFKGVGRYRSFTFPQMKQDCINGKFIKLPSFGNIKLIVHRPLPAGFKIKTATITQKADGWYIVLSLEDSSVPELSSDMPTMLCTAQTAVRQRLRYLCIGLTSIPWSGMAIV